MNSEKFKKQMNFILEIDKAKNIFRQTYISNKKRKENDAEHSWHLAIMAFILSEHFDKEIDVLKVIKTVLMHDLVEIYAGDTYCYDMKANEDKEKREIEAAKKIYSLLPDEQREEYFKLWREFEEKSTPEAVFANILDRIQPILLNYATGGKAWKEHGIYNSQVLERNKFVLENNDEFSKYLFEIIENAVNEGMLKIK